MICPGCNARIDDGVSSRCTACGAVLKGALLARLKPPFEPLGRYRIPVLAAIGALVLLYALSAHLERRDWALALAAIVVLALFVLLNRVFFLLMPVSVYENGLEIDLPRSWNKSAYLAWQDLTTYRFEGSVLHYA